MASGTSNVVGAVAAASGTFLAVNGPTSPTIQVQFDYQNAPTSPTTTWTDITAYLVSYSRQPVRGNEFDQPGPASATIVLRNDDDRFTPNNAAGPYYGSLLKYRRMRVRAQWAGVIYNRYFGYVTDWPQSWAQSGKDKTVTLTLGDGMLPLATADVSLVRSGGSGPGGTIDPNNPIGTVLPAAQSGAAIQTILTYANCPNPAVLDTGVSAIPASDPLSSPTYAAQRIKDIAASENGFVYAAGDGTIIFHDRQHRLLSARSQTSQATIGTNPGEIPYTDNVQPDYGDAWTDIVVTPPTGSPGVASNPAAETQFFQSVLTFPPSGTYLVTTAGEAQSAADYLAARYSTPFTRIPNVELIGAAATALWSTILSLDVADQVLFKRDSTISLPQFVEGYGDQVQVGKDWRVQLSLSPTQYESYWVLGDAVQGKLGQTTAISY